MRDLLAHGAKWLSQQRRDHASQWVVYSRPSTGSTRRLPATIGRTDFTYAGSNGVVINDQAIDFIVSVFDLKLDGLIAEPASGDRVTDWHGDVYELMPFGKEPLWRFVDGYQNDRRIHTRKVDSQS